MIGIKRRGVPLAERLAKLISGIEKCPIDTGVLDIQFYRDDLSTADVRPVVTPGALGCEIVGRDVVLCDDVLYTGRTIRAALDALFDHGRPRRVQLAVLIDRGHRELPIEATYIGKRVPTSSREIIEVKFQEVDHDEQVLLVERGTEDTASRRRLPARTERQTLQNAEQTASGPDAPIETCMRAAAHRCPASSPVTGAEARS